MLYKVYLKSLHFTTVTLQIRLYNFSLFLLRRLYIPCVCWYVNKEERRYVGKSPFRINLYFHHLYVNMPQKLFFKRKHKIMFINIPCFPVIMLLLNENEMLLFNRNGIVSSLFKMLPTFFEIVIVFITFCNLSLVYYKAR